MSAIAAGRMLPALRSALRLASGPLQRRLAAMELIPPLEFPCRIEPLPEGCSTIDNSLYNDTQYASSWHSTDRSKELATLDLLNAARIPYFDRVWRRQLDLPPTRPGAFLEVRGRHQHPCLRLRPCPCPCHRACYRAECQLTLGGLRWRHRHRSARWPRLPCDGSRPVSAVARGGSPKPKPDPKPDPKPNPKPKPKPNRKPNRKPNP